MAGEEFAQILEGMQSQAATSEMLTQAPLFMWSAMWLIIIALTVGILLFVAWIWLLVDCAKRTKFKNGDRVMWVLLLVLTGPIGMLLYYLMEKRK